MPKKLYTAKDIASLVQNQQIGTLLLNKGDLVTPMARDTARELGLQIVEAGSAAPPGPSHGLDVVPVANGQPASELEARVRTIVTAMFGQPGNDPTQPPARPVLHVDGRSLTMPPFPFEINRPEMDVRLEDVITAAHGAPIAAGFMSLHKGSFPWTLTYDEIDYVIEGELHIKTAQGVTIGRPGDVLYIPKNTSVHFATPSWTKFFYVTYPAEWSG